MFIFIILCYRHFYTISLLCKSYGYVIMHRYNETITSNNCCGNIVFNIKYVLCMPCPKQLHRVQNRVQLHRVQNNCTTFHHFNDLKFDTVCPIVKCIVFHVEC